jgi:hypothetical protein
MSAFERAKTVHASDPTATAWIASTVKHWRAYAEKSALQFNDKYSVVRGGYCTLNVCTGLDSLSHVLLL